MAGPSSAEITNEAFAAALDVGRWETWMAGVIPVLEGIGGTFAVLDNGSGTLRRLLPIGWSHSAEEYNSDWWQYDPLVASVMGKERTCAFLDTDHVDLGNPSTLEYMKWQRAKVRFDHHMAAAVPLGGGLVAGFSIQRSVADGYTPASSLRRLRAILPQVSRAIQLGFRHAELLQQEFWDGILARDSQQSAFLIDERGSVIRATEAALGLVARNDGLRIIGGVLRASSTKADAILGRLITNAINAADAISGAAQLERSSGLRPYVVTAFPLARSERMLAPLEAASLVRVVDPSAPALNANELYRGAFGLTAREAELANLLMLGHSPESAAARLAVSLPTVRLYLRRLLAKTQTTRQSDLIRLLSRIA